MRIRKMLAAVLMGILIVSGMGSAVTVKAAEPGIRVTTPGNTVLTYKYNEAQDFVLNVENIGTETIKKVEVSPRLGNDGEQWPFKTEYQKYMVSLEEVAPGQENMQSVKFNFMQREDVKTGRFTLAVDITALNAEGVRELLSTELFYVNTTAKPAEKKEESNNNNSSNNSSNNTGGLQNDASVFGEEQMFADAGGFSNGGASYSGGGSGSGGGTSASSVPRVIVTGFNTDPGAVKAGSNFTLIIHLKNTSKSTKVQNMLFDLAAPTEGNEQTAAPAFLPASGSNSIYLDSIAADGTADIAIQLNAKADLVQKPYSINLSMKYEDAAAAQIEAASSLSIPVKQDARFEFSEFDITSDTVAVGEEANVSCNLYNMGRIKLYNVKVSFEGNGIKKEELFLGNVDPGATASIDAMLEGEKETPEPQAIKMIMTYEDEAGVAAKAEKELKMQVAEAMDSQQMTSMPIEEPKAFPVVPVAAGVIILIVIIAVVIIRNRKKKKALMEEEEGLLDELDRPSENE